MESSEDTDITLPKDLSSVSFQKLFELKNEIGAKAYNAMISGERIQRKLPPKFHRENKNRPREMSSKIRPSIKSNKVIRVEERKPIDPRFSHSHGEFNQHKFEENYKFVERMKKKEKKILKKELDNPDTDESERRRIKLLLQRMDNQNKEKGKKKQKNNLKIAERKYHINELKEGRQPQYFKKSEKKLFDLVSQFEELKQKGGLIKHIKRRRKRLNQKDRKNLEFLST